MRKAGSQGVLDAALRVFHTRGVHGATIRAIAEEAGITEAAIYRHFSSKSHLLTTLFLRCADRLYTYLFAAQEGITDPTERLAALAQAFFDFAFAYPEEYSFIAAVHHHQLKVEQIPPERLPKRLFTEAIRELLGPQADAEQVELIAGAVIGAVMGVVLMAEIGAVSDMQRARQTVAQAARCLAPEPALAG